jgi:hypothetical protein
MTTTTEQDRQELLELCDYEIARFHDRKIVLAQDRRRLRIATALRSLLQSGSESGGDAQEEIKRLRAQVERLENTLINLMPLVS